MNKILTLFMRNYESDRLVRNEVTPGAEWVIQGEGIATRKYDGTCCLIKNRKLFKRYELKKGKTAPKDFEPSQEPDSVTGNVPGWLPVTNSPEDKWHREAFEAHAGLPDGTYELCGPKINGNNEKLSIHMLIKHGEFKLNDFPREFEEIKSHLKEFPFEGVVWHHPDGRMVKIKRRDFGHKRDGDKP